MKYYTKFLLTLILIYFIYKLLKEQNFKDRKYKKILFVGFNKTASSSIHKLLKKNNYKSKHTVNNFENYIDKYDVLVDPGNEDIQNVINFKNIYLKYPEAIFILNTRDLNSWLVSRSKHYYRRGVIKSDRFGYPINKKIIIDWIKERNQYYYKLLNFFKNKKNKFIILDIDNSNWIDFLSDNLSIKKIDVYENKTLECGDKYMGIDDKYKIPDKYNNKIISSINNAYKELNINDPKSKLFNKSIINKSIDDYGYKNNLYNN